MDKDNNIYCVEALNYEKSLATQFLVLGEYLYNIKEKGLFSPQYASFNEFCMEFKSLSQGSISKLTSIYKKFVLDYKIPTDKLIATGGWASLAEIVPLVTSKENAEEWIQKAGTLSRGDLRKEIIESKTGKDMRDCQHADSYDIQVCRECHEKIKIRDSRV